MSGTYTFLYTDIEGSIALWQSAHEAMTVAVERHDALLSPLFEAHGGHVFKTAGDAFYVAFLSAPDALRAAMTAQQLLHAEPWALPQPFRVRMALHTGVAQARGGDYFGLAPSYLERLMEVAHGGQILLTEATQTHTKDALPSGASLRDLGSARLRSLERAERIYQVRAPGLADDFPPLRSLEAFSHNLPVQLTSFVGREREIEEVAAVCRAKRLVTLTGPGGGGKTRLALQVAAGLVEDFADGVWLVELAALTDAALAPSAVAAAVGARQEGGQSVLDALTACLKPQKLLLILDNCEHVIDAAARLAQSLLQTCPSLTILATSRERLDVPGESVWSVPPLGSPPAQSADTVESVLASEAATLFLERAAAAQPRFRLSAGNAGAVLQVCRRMEGLPLALELAAASVRMMPVDHLARRLEDRFNLLPAGPRSGAERHRTLQAAIDWSYDLLTDRERTLLRGLSVFAGGWTLEAAESVCAGKSIAEGDVLDLLSHLVDKSLVTPEEEDGAARYRLLDTLRAYSVEKMAGDSELADISARHAAYFLQWAEEAEPRLNGPDQAEWLNRIERDHDNLRAALRFLRNVDPERFQRLASALYGFWYTRGYITEGRTWLEQAIKKADAAPTLARAKAINRAGVLVFARGDDEAARVLFEQSLEMRRGFDDKAGVAATLNNLAMVASNCRDFDRARVLYEEALAIYRCQEDSPLIATTLHNLGSTALDRGDYSTALRSFEEAFRLFQALHYEQGVANSLACLGSLSFLRSDFAQARSYLQKSLELCCQSRNLQGIAYIVEYFGFISIAEDDEDLGIRLLGAGETLRGKIQSPRSVFNESIHGNSVMRAREKSSDTKFNAAWQTGGSSTLEQILEWCSDPRQ